MTFNIQTENMRVVHAYPNDWQETCDWALKPNKKGYCLSKQIWCIVGKEIKVQKKVYRQKVWRVNEVHFSPVMIY